MALVPCRECGKEVSDAAERCPNCGISTPSKKRRQIKLATTLLIVLLILGACAYGYHRISQAFAPPVTVDGNGNVIPPPAPPKLQKTIPVKQQIIQKDYKDKIRELLDSGESVMSISKQTGIRSDEVRRIKKEWKQAQKDK